MGVPVQGMTAPVISLLNIQLASDYHDIMEVPGKVLVILNVFVFPQFTIAGAPQDMVHTIDISLATVTLP